MSSRKLLLTLPAAHTARIGCRSKKALTEALQHGVFSSVFTTYDKEIETLTERLLTEIKNVYSSNIAIFPQPESKKKKEPATKTKVVKGKKKPDPKAEVEDDDDDELEEELDTVVEEDDELDEADLALIKEIAEAAAKPKAKEKAKKKKGEPADKSGKISNMGGNPSNNPIAVE